MPITSISPESIAGGSAAFTLTVDGSGFVDGSSVHFGGTALATTFMSAARLTAQVPAAPLATPNDAHLPRVIHVTVVDPAGAASDPANFTLFHLRPWHMLDSHFAEENQGLTLPVRNLTEENTAPALLCRTAGGTDNGNVLVCDTLGLQITNLDRADPPNYQANGVPRGNTFNANVFRISTEPRMPVIAVRCQTVGFFARAAPIYWRLQVRHVLCRHQSQGNYRYRGVCEILNDEWQGKSRSPNFTLFEPSSDPDLDYDYNSNDPGGPVMGGHAILSVAAKPPGAQTVLLDYVHLRINAADNPNPTRADVLRHLNEVLNGRDANFSQMALAVVAHENGYKQFEDNAQTVATMHFVQKHHGRVAGQPQCDVFFDWPDDPAHFPSIAFDWGIGLMQFQKSAGMTIGPGPIWDWRENIFSATNELLGKLRHTFQANSTWRAWAKRGWKAYNGAGPQAEEYANTLEALPEGQGVSLDAVPATLDWQAQTAAIAAAPARPAAPPWPPPTLTLP